MSICRWSSNDWDCDLYCYERVDDMFVTHVASRRYKNVPKNPYSYTEAVKWVEFYIKQSKALDTADMEKINLPYDGMTFADPDIDSFVERVNCLKEAGYHVPDYVLDIEM